MWGKMSGQKRPAGTGLIEGSPCKKRSIPTKTVDKWIAENDKALNMMTWLQYDRKDCEYAASVKCVMCIRYQDRLHGVRNYNPAFITGSIQIFGHLPFKNHARSDMHP